jgi:hypothetical protein
MSFLSGAIDQVFRLSFFIKAFVYEATAQIKRKSAATDSSPVCSPSVQEFPMRRGASHHSVYDPVRTSTARDARARLSLAPCSSGARRSCLGAGDIALA